MIKSVLVLQKIITNCRNQSKYLSLHNAEFQYEIGEYFQKISWDFSVQLKKYWIPCKSNENSLNISWFQREKFSQRMKRKGGNKTKFYNHLNDKNRFTQKKKNEVSIKCLLQNIIFQKTLASYCSVLRGKILWLKNVLP